MRDHLKSFILLILALIVCLPAAPIWAQRNGDVYQANPATDLDDCDVSVQYILVPTSSQSGYAQGDVADLGLYVNTHLVTAERIEATISYAGTELEYNGVDTAGYPRPWGSADWVIIEDPSEQKVNVVVNIGSANAVTINDVLMRFKFTYGCKEWNKDDTVLFAENCTENGLLSTANSIDNNGLHLGAGVTLPFVAKSWGSNLSAIIPVNAESGPDQPVTVPLRFISGRNNTGGFTLDLAYDDTKLEYVDIDPTGTITEGTDVNATHVVAAGAPDTIKIACTDALGSRTAGAWLLYVQFNNLMPTHLDQTAVQLRHVELTDCYGTMQATDGAATVTTVFRATMSIADLSMVYNTTGSARVSLTTNFDVNMDTESGRAIFNLLEENIALVTITGITDLADDYTFEEHTDAGTGDWMVWEAAGSGNSSTIPASATPYELFDINFSAGNDCGTTPLDFKGGNLGNASQISWADDDAVVIRHMFPDYYLEFQGGQVSVTGCPGGGTPSCPFVTVWNGSQFVEENTILTQSEYSPEGVPVVDNYMLNARPALEDGMYRLRIEEREDETSYLDQIKLMVAEGQPGRPVSVTPEGTFFYTALSLKPSKAVDQNGKDVLALVSSEDGQIFVGNGAGSLTVTYEPPTSQSGVVMFAQGAGEKELCPRIPKIGDGVNDADKIRLRISYRENGGAWVELPQGPPRAMGASEFRSTDLQLNAGSVIDVKYEWQNRWTTDDLSLAVADEEVPQVMELEPVAVFHNALGKVAGTLDRADNQFAVLNKGEWVELQFPASRRPDLRAETHFVVAAKGYYVPYAQSNGLQLPNNFALHPNYPNPFNAQTNISFALPFESEVEVVVYNVLGQTVKTLATGVLAAGEHTVNWDGTNAQGNPVASGTYFIRMKSGDFQQQRKMTLLK